jgi:hypothetical protein
MMIRIKGCFASSPPRFLEATIISFVQSNSKEKRTQKLLLSFDLVGKRRKNKRKNTRRNHIPPPEKEVVGASYLDLEYKWL